MTPAEAEIREEEFLIPLEDDSDSTNSEDEDTCDDVADEDVEVGGEEAKQSEDEQKYDEVVEDGDLEPGQIYRSSNPGRGCRRTEGLGAEGSWSQAGCFCFRCFFRQR